MFVTIWISTTKIQKISEITNFLKHYFLSRTEVKKYFGEDKADVFQNLDFKKLYEEGKIEFEGDSYIPEESIYLIKAVNGEKHKCPHCGKSLTPSVLGDYDWQCPDCEEDFYNFELKD